MKKKSHLLILLTGFLLLADTAFMQGLVMAARAASTGKITTTDFRGKAIILPFAAKRIVCLIESALSGIFMLGVENRVVGISANVYDAGVFDYYAAMDPRIRNHELPTPGNWDFVNLERVIALKPDLVIIWANQEESIAAMEESDIPVYGVFIDQLEDINKEIIDLGILTGSEQRAKSLVHFAETQLNGIQKKLSRFQVKRPKRVYYMWAQGELETAGKNSMVQQLIFLSGAKNVAGHIDQEHLVINIENILTWDPEVIVMWYNDRKDPADIMENGLWHSVSAVKLRNVYEFPDVFSCDLWTLKYLHAVALVTKWCYPELFQDVDPEIYQWELLRNLYGNKLDPKKVEQLQITNNK